MKSPLASFGRPKIAPPDSTSMRATLAEQIAATNAQEADRSAAASKLSAAEMAYLRARNRCSETEQILVEAREAVRIYQEQTDLGRPAKAPPSVTDARKAFEAAEDARDVAIADVGRLKADAAGPFMPLSHKRDATAHAVLHVEAEETADRVAAKCLAAWHDFVRYGDLLQWFYLRDFYPRAAHKNVLADSDLGHVLNTFRNNTQSGEGLTLSEKIGARRRWDVFAEALKTDARAQMPQEDV